MKNMDRSNSNVSPNCCAGRPDEWVHSYLYTWQPNCFLPSKFTEYKVLMGCILFQSLANQQHLSKAVPRLHLLLVVGGQKQATHFLPMLPASHTMGRALCLPMENTLAGLLALVKCSWSPAQAKCGLVKSHLVHRSMVALQPVLIRACEMGNCCII